MSEHFAMEHFITRLGAIVIFVLVYWRIIICFRRTNRLLYKIAIVLFIGIHLTCWAGTYLVESRRAATEFEHLKISVKEINDLYESQGIHHREPYVYYRCISPLPFLFVCKEGYNAGPQAGGECEYIAISFGFKTYILKSWGMIS
jgi:hypothetical protein